MTDDFAVLLRNHREKRGFSMGGLAKMSGTQAPTISLVERGERTPPKKAVLAWSKAFQLEGRELAEFLESASRAKAHAQQESIPYANHIEEKVRKLQAIISLIIELLDIPEYRRRGLVTLAVHELQRYDSPSEVLKQIELILSGELDEDLRQQP